MEFREIAPRLSRATRQGTNVYLVDQGTHSVLIDTGTPDFATPVLKALADHPPVRQILLTHAHYDHAGGAAALSRDLEAPVFAQPAEADLLRHGRWRRQVRPSPTVVGQILTRLVANRYPDRIAAISDIQPILDCAGIALTGVSLLALPGHSAGQLGFGIPQPSGRTAWLVGDVVMTMPRLSEPIPYEDRSLGLASIGALARAVALGDLICPGHGAPVEVTAKRLARLERLARGA